MSARTIVVLLVALACSTCFAQPGSGFPDIPQPTFNRPVFSPPSMPDIPRPSYSPPSFPKFEPPPTPEFPRLNEPSFPDFSTPSFEEVQVCTNCNNEVGSTAMVGQSCPHCGVTWTHTTFEPMGSRPPMGASSPMGSSSSPGFVKLPRGMTPAENFNTTGANSITRGWGLLIGAACAVLSLGGLFFAGIVFLVMILRPKPASTSNMPPVVSRGYSGSRFSSHR